ncbi:MAG: serine hydrolase, partial [Clostridia bacterium]|nr:serine hydrolase [Clostridia bacterium]
MKRSQIVIFILALVLTMELFLPSCTQEKLQPHAQTEAQTMQAESESSDYPLLEIAFEAIDDIVSADIAHGFPSAQIAVMKDGKMLYENCWGLANSYNENGERLETGAPVTEDTLYDLASNTKMYAVIYAVQYLVSQGALDLDTPVVDILGDGFAEDVIDISYEQGERVDREEQIQWKRSITVREVLSHQAGFPPSLHYYDPHYDVSKRISGPEYENVLYQGTDFEKSDIPELLFRTPLMKKPGGEPLYSDIGYMLMTFILEKVTGEPLDVFLSEVFWEPMGLDHIAYTPLAYGFSADQIAATELHGNTRDFLYDFDGIR